jgi:protein gp37
VGANTKIEWCDFSFNPWWGCTKVSPGCDNCYAERDSTRFGHAGLWGTGEFRTFGDAHWRAPLLWNEKARHTVRRPRVFCASMADVFDNQAPEAERQRLFRLIAATPNLDWLLLTKRIGNAAKMLPERWMLLDSGVYQNVWLGISVINQEEAERDIPKLAAMPAHLRFLSCEPLLDHINLHKISDALMLDWIICGGESGSKARPMAAWWAKALRGYCALNGISFFMKQGSQANWISFKDFAKFPDGLRVREFPLTQ